MSLAAANRRRRIAAFALGCALIVATSGAWRPPANIPRGVEYVPQAIYLLATAGGTIDLTFFGWTEDGAPPDDPVHEWLSVVSADDLGYPVLREAWLLATGDKSREAVQRLHNLVALVCSLALAAAAGLMTRSLLAAWTALSLALVLRGVLRGMLFGSLDNRTFIIFFPLALPLLLVLVPRVTRAIPRPLAVLGAMATGAVVQGADLVRHSEGLLAYAACFVAYGLARASLWRRASALGLVLIGAWTTTNVLTGGIRIFNDIRTGRFAVDPASYLRSPTPSRHPPWHSLVISLGRYDNPEGLYYDDQIGFESVRRAFPDIVERDGPFEAAHAYYFWYVRRHPTVWVRTVVRGLAEMAYFVPYVTSVGTAPWAMGYLPAKAGVVPHVIEHERDVPYDLKAFPRLRRVGHGSLLNLRPRYLKLSVGEWSFFILSLTLLPSAVYVARRAGDRDNCTVFLALACYLLLGVGVRSLIPVHGECLVAAYWGTSMLAVLYLLFGATEACGRAGPWTTRGARRRPGSVTSTLVAGNPLLRLERADPLDECRSPHGLPVHRGRLMASLALPRRRCTAKNGPT